MIKGLAVAALLPLLAFAANADERIDDSIDAAARRIVAARIGEIRLALVSDELPEMVRPRDGSATATARPLYRRF